MANRTLINDKADGPDPFSMTALQSQLARIKKEEEEEILISGEELYTEGSSDEEIYETVSRPRRKLNTNKKTRASSSSRNLERQNQPSQRVVVTDTSKTSNIPIHTMENHQNKGKPAVAKVTTSIQKECLSKIGPQQEPPAPPPTPTQNTNSKDCTEQNCAAQSSDEEDDEPVGFSWKAKRGTIVLPNCTNLLSGESNKC